MLKMCKKDKIQNIIELLNKERTHDENISCGVAFDRWVSDNDLALIIDALEKQIAKKPIETTCIEPIYDECGC